VQTQRKGDEQRLFEVLHKLELEDPCFKVERHPGTNETVIRGLGDMHLRAKLLRMQQQYKLELDTSQPQIAYIETITAQAEGHCRHKKQSGGAGQFGEVMLRVEPLARGAGFEFVDVVKGGAIPGVFMAAVEKGVRQALSEGVVAGFPVHDLRVTVYDGKTHSVDGKEVAFVAAARKATLDALLCRPPHRAGAHGQHRSHRPRQRHGRPDWRLGRPSRPCHRLAAACRGHREHHRPNAVGRVGRLPESPQIAHGWAGLVQPGVFTLRPGQRSNPGSLGCGLQAGKR
jgi:hypothetical protein